MTRVRRVLLVSAMAVVAVFAFPSTAYADNCGSLTDCYNTAQAALAALVGLSVLFGVILSFTLDLLPGIGTIKGLIEAYTGRDLITGQELEWWERALGVLPVLGHAGRLAEGAADALAAARSGRAAGRGGSLFGGLSTGRAPSGGGGMHLGGGLGVPRPPGAVPGRHRGMQLDPRGPGRAPEPRPRPYQPPLDTRTAGTGGIERINQGTDVFGARTVTIEGRVQDSIPDRARNAPNYNQEPHWRDIRNELGVPDYEAAHRWGPGFGDEAAAGVMLAPRGVNQVVQGTTERYIRELGDEARAYGGDVRVTATATSHGSDVRGGDALLGEANYDITVVDRAGNVVDGKRVSISVDPPPSGRVHDVQVSDLPPPGPRR